MAAEKLSVGELAVTKLVTLKPVPTCSELVDTLRACLHQAFPITPETQQASQIGHTLCKNPELYFKTLDTMPHSIHSFVACWVYVEGSPKDFHDQ